MLVTFVSQLLSVLTVVGQGLGIGLLALIVKTKARPPALGRDLPPLVTRNALLFAFIVALTATLGSLFYSEVAKYTPCLLCWYQRIFMYPQTLLLGLATLKKDAKIAAYSLTLSLVGLVIAAYHYSLQINPNPLAPCSTVGYSVSCSQRFAAEYGYITIPMMSLTAFALIALAMIILKLSQKPLVKPRK